MGWVDYCGEVGFEGFEDLVDRGFAHSELTGTVIVCCGGAFDFGDRVSGDGLSAGVGGGDGVGERVVELSEPGWAGLRDGPDCWVGGWVVVEFRGGEVGVSVCCNRKV